MTRQDFIEQHKRNVEWANRQIRICLMARRLLKNDKPRNYEWLINHADTNNRPDLLPLKEAIKDDEGWRLRFQNYNLALLATVFDIRKFIFEARSLKWKAQDKPWLTPA